MKLSAKAFSIGSSAADSLLSAKVAGNVWLVVECGVGWPVEFATTNCNRADGCQVQEKLLIRWSETWVRDPSNCPYPSSDGVDESEERIVWRKWWRE